MVANSNFVIFRLSIFEEPYLQKINRFLGYRCESTFLNFIFTFAGGRPGRPSLIQPISKLETQQTNGGSDHLENIPPSVKNRVSELPRPTPVSAAPQTRANGKTLQIQNSNSRATIVQTPQMSAVVQSNAGQRRSYVVKEVEKLKENREKRRAKQAEMREEKVALMNMDPGNPNWELSAMIR